MSQKTIYTCDRCKKEGENISLTIVALGIKSTIYGYYNNEFNLTGYKKEIGVCDECLIALGIKQTPKTPAPSTQPSLEDIIRDIMREEIEYSSQR